MKRVPGFITFVSITFLLPCFLGAEVRMPAVFGDHMVLQRNQESKFWGWADPGEKVEVQFAGKRYNASAEDDGSWELRVEALPAGGPYDLRVSGSNELNFADLMVGEVWICSGQSNMEWPIERSNCAQIEIAAANHPDIRMIAVPRVGTQEAQLDFEGRWERCSPEVAASFSSVGYFSEGN